MKGSEKLVKTFYFKFTVENKDEEQSLNRCDAIGSQRNLLRYENKCNRLWNPDYGKIQLWNPESWVLESRIQLKKSGIRQTIGIRIQVLLTNTGIQNPQRGIQNPRMSQFFLLRMKLVQCSSKKQPTFCGATTGFPAK